MSKVSKQNTPSLALLGATGSPEGSTRLPKDMGIKLVEVVAAEEEVEEAMGEGAVVDVEEEVEEDAVEEGAASYP